jgi:hypothetical protein
VREGKKRMILESNQHCKVEVRIWRVDLDQHDEWSIMCIYYYFMYSLDVVFYFIFLLLLGNWGSGILHTSLA